MCPGGAAEKPGRWNRLRRMPAPGVAETKLLRLGNRKGVAIAIPWIDHYAVVLLVERYGVAAF